MVNLFRARWRWMASPSRHEHLKILLLTRTKPVHTHTLTSNGAIGIWVHFKTFNCAALVLLGTLDEFCFADDLKESTNKTMLTRHNFGFIKSIPGFNIDVNIP